MLDPHDPPKQDGFQSLKYQKYPARDEPINRDDPADKDCEMWIEALPVGRYRKKRTGRLWLYDAVTGYRRLMQHREAKAMANRLKLGVTDNQLSDLKVWTYSMDVSVPRLPWKKSLNPDVLHYWHKAKKPSEDPTMSRLLPRVDDNDTDLNIPDSNIPILNVSAVIAQKIEDQGGPAAQNPPALVGSRKRKAALFDNPRSPLSPPRSPTAHYLATPKRRKRKPKPKPSIDLRAAPITDTPHTSRDASGPVQGAADQPAAQITETCAEFVRRILAEESQRITASTSRNAEPARPPPNTPTARSTQIPEPPSAQLRTAPGAVQGPSAQSAAQIRSAADGSRDEPRASRNPSGPMQFVFRPVRGNPIAQQPRGHPDSSPLPVSNGVAPQSVSSSDGALSTPLHLSSGVPPLSSECTAAPCLTARMLVRYALARIGGSTGDATDNTTARTLESGVTRGVARFGVPTILKKPRTVPPRIETGITQAHVAEASSGVVSPDAPTTSATPRAVPLPVESGVTQAQEATSYGRAKADTQPRVDTHEIKEEEEEGDQNLMERPVVRGDGYVPQETCWSVEVHDGRKEKDEEVEKGGEEGGKGGGDEKMMKRLHTSAEGSNLQETTSRVDAHDVKEEEEEEVENLMVRPDADGEGTQLREDGHEVKEEEDERNANLMKQSQAGADGVKHETPSRFSTRAGSDVEERDEVMEEMEENGDAISEQLEDDEAYLGDCENAEDSDQSDDVTLEDDDGPQVRSPTVPPHEDDGITAPVLADLSDLTNLTEVVSNVNNRQFASIPAPLQQLLGSINLEALVDLRNFVRSGGAIGPT